MTSTDTAQTKIQHIRKNSAGCRLKTDRFRVTDTYNNQFGPDSTVATDAVIHFLALASIGRPGVCRAKIHDTGCLGSVFQ